MKHFRNITSVLLKVLLLLLFIGYNESLTLFYHAHQLDGQVVFHSHPFKQTKKSGNTTPSHHHSPKELYYIQQLNLSLWEDTSFSPQVLQNSISIEEQIFSLSTYFCPSGIQNTFHLRGPPAATFFS